MLKNHLYSYILGDESLNSKSFIDFGGSKFSYQSVFQAAHILSENIAGTSDLKGEGTLQGSVFAIKVSSTSQFISAFLAVIELGGVVFPISSDLPASVASKNLERITPDYILVDESSLVFFGSEYDSHRVGNDNFYLLSRQLKNNSLKKFREGGFIRFTSGTTGNAKGVYISQSSALERVMLVQNFANLNSEDVVLNMMPLAYHFIVSVLWFLRCKVNLLIPTLTTLHSLLQFQDMRSVSMIYASPFHYNLLLGLSPENFATKLRLAISTGAKISNETYDLFYKIFGKRISEAYGLIEVGLPLVATSEEHSFQRSLGRPLPGYEVGFFDEKNNFKKSLRDGILAIRGPGMFDCYIDPYLPRESVLIDGWFLTNDHAYLNSSGEVVVSGRISSVINVLGHKVFPEEVEEVLNIFPGVLESKVIGTPHAQFGSSIKAMVVMKDQTSVSELELRSFCRKKLEKFKVPREVEFVPSIARTETGKVFRNFEKDERARVSE